MGRNRRTGPDAFGRRALLCGVWAAAERGRERVAASAVSWYGPIDVVGSSRMGFGADWSGPQSGSVGCSDV
jgi:hypothetical protein